MRLPGFNAQNVLVEAGRGFRARFPALEHRTLSGIQEAVVIPQRCQKGYIDYCRNLCIATCPGTEPGTPPPPKTTCRKICCVAGQPQFG
jgi:hypothetical protein